MRLGMVNSNEELKCFFEELKDSYVHEKHNFVWDWDKISDYNEFVYYIAYHLSKDIIHGPLPANLHSRMVFNKNAWTKKYFDYLEGK